MLWPITESCEEPHGDEVEKALGKAAKAILGSTVLPPAMVDDQFTDLEAACVGQDRNEAVQFAIELHFPEDFGPVCLHAAVVVVQFHTGDAPDQPVEDATRPDLVPRIVA